jgi:hypothetical protein
LLVRVKIERSFGQQRVSTLMKAQLLAGKDMIIGELLWPDDFSDADLTDRALKALGNYYKAIGRRMVPRPQYKVVPSEIRVLTYDGTEIGRWTIVDLAKSLGKEHRER